MVFFLKSDSYGSFRKLCTYIISAGGGVSSGGGIITTGGGAVGGGRGTVAGLRGAEAGSRGSVPGTAGRAGAEQVEPKEVDGNWNENVQKDTKEVESEKKNRPEEGAWNKG